MVNVITVLVYTSIVSVHKVFLINRQLFGQYHTSTFHSRFNNTSSFPFLFRCKQQFCERRSRKNFSVLPGYLNHFNYKNFQVNPGHQSSLCQITISFAVDDAIIECLSGIQLLWPVVAKLTKGVVFSERLNYKNIVQSK